MLVKSHFFMVNHHLCRLNHIFSWLNHDLFTSKPPFLMVKAPFVDAKNGKELVFRQQQRQHLTNAMGRIGRVALAACCCEMKPTGTPLWFMILIHNGVYKYNYGVYKPMYKYNWGESYLIVYFMGFICVGFNKPIYKRKYLINQLYLWGLMGLMILIMGFIYYTTMVATCCHMLPLWCHKPTLLITYK